MEQKTILSITTIAATEVLKTFKDQGIKCDYIGIDQNGRILMEITYTPDDEPTLSRLRKYMESCELFMAEINEALKKYVLELNHRDNELLEQIRIKKQGLSKFKTQVNGDEKHN